MHRGNHHSVLLQRAKKGHKPDAEMFMYLHLTTAAGSSGGLRGKRIIICRRWRSTDLQTMVGECTACTPGEST